MADGQVFIALPIDLLPKLTGRREPSTVSEVRNCIHCDRACYVERILIEKYPEITDTVCCVCMAPEGPEQLAALLQHGRPA